MYGPCSQLYTIEQIRSTLGYCIHDRFQSPGQSSSRSDVYVRQMRYENCNKVW